jgi:hypothetical protein
MARRYGAARVVAAHLGDGTLIHDGRRDGLFHHINFGDFVASLSRPGPAAAYVMAPVWDFPESFQNEYRVPTYCADAIHLRSKVWVGKAGTVTPMHRDVPHNFYVHLSGRKRWLLFSPKDSARLYPHGIFSGMPNFARVDPERPDYGKYPRLRGATAYGVTLGRGETLFIPHGWWHYARSIDDTVSMNFWWGGRLVALVASASSIFKRVRRLHGKEWE